MSPENSYECDHNRLLGKKKHLIDEMWWASRDSNPGPTGYEPGALTD